MGMAYSVRRDAIPWATETRVAQLLPYRSAKSQLSPAVLRTTGPTQTGQSPTARRFSTCVEKRAISGTVTAITSTSNRTGSEDEEFKLNTQAHVMEQVKKTTESKETHKPARPIQFIKDRYGNGWLCDKGIDPDGDLEAQGCWRCEDMAFPMGGH